MTLYKRRNDGTVMAYDERDGIMAVFRLKPGTENVTQAVNIHRETEPAAWTGPISEASGHRLNRTVFDMLRGVQPKTANGSTGFKIGTLIGVASAFVGGPVGPIVGGILGLVGGGWLGGKIKTNAPGVTMTPLIEVEGAAEVEAERVGASSE
jgi:hypothetical protein